jgi:EAL and modified HD-GYP domain-containing signal transduction protein
MAAVLNDANVAQSFEPSAEPNGREESSPPMAIVGRQPILDRKLDVVAYELLFRPSRNQVSAPFDGDRATAEVILTTLTEIGLDNVVGKHRAFINFTEKLLTDSTAQLLPKDRVVLEILEDAIVTDELVDAVAALVDQGHELALDDFVYSPQWDRLLPLASIVKIDVLALNAEQIVAELEHCKPYNVRMLAEKVETQEQFEASFNLGFELFQGYFFAKPKIIAQQRLPENHINLLRLLTKLQDTSAATGEIENLVSADVALSFKLLRYINSAHFAFPRQVDSIHRALVYMGLDMLRKWASLMAMSSVEGKPSALFETALVRARMCELLAERVGAKETGNFFTVGLFSMLSALLDTSIEEILAMLPLANEIDDALTEYGGPLGEALRCALSCERGDSSEMKFSDLDEMEIGNLYVESMQWAFEAGASV